MPGPAAFPQLPSAANPYAGAASSIADGMMRYISSRQEQMASQQQAQQKAYQQDLKDQFEEELKLRDKGYTPYLNNTGRDSSGLMRRDSQQVDPSRIVSDSHGRKWVVPDPNAEKKPTQQQSYSDQTSLLEKGAQPIDPNGNVWQDTTTPRVRMNPDGSTTDTGTTGVHVAVPDQSRVVTPPGGKQSFYIPPEEQTLQHKLEIENANKATPQGSWDVDTEHFSSPVTINRSTGEVKAIKLPEGVTHNTKPAASPNESIISGFESKAGNPLVRDPKSGKVTELELPPGSKRAMTPAQTEADKDRHQRQAETDANREQGRLDKLEGKIQDLQKVEQQQHGLRQVYGDALKTPDGAMVIDPDSHQEYRMNAARRKYYEGKLKAATDKVAELQGEQKKVMDSMSGRKPAAAPAPAAAPPASQNAGGGRGGQQKAGGTATIADVDAYVKAKADRGEKVSRAQAIRAFQDGGFTITGQQ